MTSINTTDEFWAERLQSLRETELCVPAETTGCRDGRGAAAHAAAPRADR